MIKYNMNWIQIEEEDEMIKGNFNWVKLQGKKND